MAINKIIYPVDLTGTAKSNRITGENHTIGKDRYRAIALNGGPFYAESVVVMDRGRNKRLDAGKDFACLYFYDEISKLTKGLEVTGVLLITNPDVSVDISVDYNLVGGPWVSNVHTIKQAIDDLDLDNRSTAWKNILEKPETFMPPPHLHDIGDVFGFEYIISVLVSMKDAILIGDGQTMELVKDYIDRAIQILTNNVETFKARRDNPHHVTAHQTGTLTREEIQALINDIHDALSDLEPRFAEIVKDISDMQHVINSINEALSTHSDRIGSVEERQSRIDLLIAQLNDRITNINGEIDRIDRELELIRQKNTAQDAILADHAKKLEDYKKIIDQHTSKLNTHDQEIEALKQKNTAQDQVVAALQQLLNQQVSNLQQQITGNDNDIAALRREIDTIKQKNTAQDNSINSVVSVNNSQHNEIEALKRRLSTLESDSAKLEVVAGGASVSGLVPGKRYAIFATGVTGDRGVGGAWLGGVAFKNSSGGVIGQGNGLTVNWPDGNAPQTGFAVITAPSNGIVYGYMDYNTQMTHTGACKPALNMMAIRV